LRCIGTSASLTGEEGRDYVQQFFGVDGDTFEITEGEPRAIEEQEPLPRAAFVAAHAHAGSDDYVERLVEAAAGHNLTHAIAAACLEDGSTRAMPVTAIDAAAFDEEPDGELVALEAALDAIALGAVESEIPFRAHLFTRLVRGIWACSNPDCDQVDP